MMEVKSYHFKPTKLIPNSPYPLLHYPGFLTSKEDCDAAAVHELFAKNGWNTQWIFRYGSTQASHYHSATHECMAVLSGTATIRFGVADTDDDLEVSTHGNGKEDGGIELEANAGDVFVIPAGVSHKTYDTAPAEAFKLLTPGNGHKVETSDITKALSDIRLSGFTMIGAYPEDGVWDFAVGGDHLGAFEDVWAIPKPPRDPVMGEGRDGLCGLWS